VGAWRRDVGDKEKASRAGRRIGAVCALSGVQGVLEVGPFSALTIVQAALSS